ncbi:MAG: hypothetical protein VB135_00135 [Burkholderia sp.]
MSTITQLHPKPPVAVSPRSNSTETAPTGEAAPEWISSPPAQTGLLASLVVEHADDEDVDDFQDMPPEPPADSGEAVGDTWIVERYLGSGGWEELLRCGTALEADAAFSLDQQRRIRSGADGEVAAQYTASEGYAAGKLFSPRFEAALAIEAADRVAVNESDQDGVPLPDAVVKDLPAALAAWEAQVSGFRSPDLVSEDKSLARAAAEQWTQLVLRAIQLDAVYDGVEDIAKEHLPRKLASKMQVELEVARAKDQVATKVAAMGGAEVSGGDAGEPTWHGTGGGGGGGGGVIDALVKAPFTALSAGGSMVLQGLRAAQSAAGSVVDRRRRNAFDVLGTQVHSVEQTIADDASWLRSHGLGQIADELKASGLAPSAAVGEMKRGGKLERLGLQLKGMMLEPEVNERVQRLQKGLAELHEKADRYAKAGAAIDRDPSDLLDPVMDRLKDSVGDLPVADKDGAFSHMGEKLQEITEKIRELVERLMSKFMPRGP